VQLVLANNTRKKIDVMPVLAGEATVSACVWCAVRADSVKQRSPASISQVDFAASVAAAWIHIPREDAALLIQAAPQHAPYAHGQLRVLLMQKYTVLPTQICRLLHVAV
jgi:hypothetical protein